MRKWKRQALAALVAAAILSSAAAVLGQAQQPGHASASSSIGDPSLNGVDEFITSVMKEWKVPGLAVAVVKDGKIILSKGYGYRDVEKGLAVTPRTLFAIGSISKSFTVTLLSMLADDGKLDWDEPLRTYMPDFQLHDPVATLHMTPRDLVTHRSGLPRHDGLWYGSDLTRKQMYERLRYLESSKGFRAAYQYNNLMFMTAGLLAERLGGSRWEDLVRQRILQPLGMSRSNFTVNDSQKADDFALPYLSDKDVVKPIPFRNIDEIGPAGSINSSVEEMIRYVQFHIGKGREGDRQLLSERGAEQMQTPQMAVSGTIQYDEVGHSSYGLGLAVGAYRGNKVVEHGGGIDGFISFLSFMPGKKIGMIVLSNLAGDNPAPVIVTRNIYDRVLGLDQVDWVARTKTQQEKARKAQEEAKKKNYTPRKEGTSPSHALPDYAGNYEHPAYGRFRIDVDGSGLKASFKHMSFALKHYHYDIFEVSEGSSPGPNPLLNVKVTFSYNKAGEIDRLAIPLEAAVSDIVFTRAADETLSRKDLLERFVGEYQIEAQTITVALQGQDTLMLTVAGQPTYQLVPVRDTLFNIKGLNGYSVEFKKGESESIVELVLHQPNGSFVAKRK